jgi:hypothetical protein
MLLHLHHIAAEVHHTVTDLVKYHRMIHYYTQPTWLHMCEELQGIYGLPEWQ